LFFFLMRKLRGSFIWIIRPKKNICVFTVTCQKNLGSVGRDSFFIFFIIGKTGNSRFRNRIQVFLCSPLYFEIMRFDCNSSCPLYFEITRFDCNINGPLYFEIKKFDCNISGPLYSEITRFDCNISSPLYFEITRFKMVIRILCKNS
jgi:hypothetical protein